MANEASCSRNLRKKVRKNYSEMIKDECFSDPSSPLKNQGPETMDFQCNISDFDCCRLTEKEVPVYCELCAKAKQETMTKYSCKTCGVACCVSCYNIHNKEQMLESLRSFCVNCAPNQEISISETGEMSTVLSSDKVEFPKASCSRKPKKHSAKKDSLAKVLDNLQNEFIRTGVEFYRNETLNCIFYQDKQMKEFFNCYPEFISLDVTCEIIALEYILYLFISEDSNADCEIVAACLLKSNDVCSLSWLCDIFKKHNPNWQKIRLILADQQIKNVEIIQNSFPFSAVLLSLFHATQSFKAALSNFDIEKSTKASALKLFENMIHSTSESKCEKLYDEMKIMPNEIALYFMESWHSKSTWRIAAKFASNSFLNPIAKFLCFIRKKMKTMLNTKESVESLFRSFFVIVSNLRKDKFETLSNVFQTMPVSSHIKSPQYKYAKFLTRYAGKIVLDQLNLISEVKNIQRLASGKYEICYESTVINISTTSCSCDFYSVLSLPCSHIFAVRKLLSLPMFSETLCSTRWIAKSYQNAFINLHSLFMKHGYSENVYKHYSEERFRKYFELCGQLFPLVANNNQRAAVLDNVLEAWKYNISVNVKVSEKLPVSENRELELDCSIDHLKDVYGVSVDEHLDSDGDFSAVSLYSQNSDDELLKCIEDGETFSEANNG